MEDGYHNFPSKFKWLTKRLADSMIRKNILGGVYMSAAVALLARKPVSPDFGKSLGLWRDVVSFPPSSEHTAG